MSWELWGSVLKGLPVETVTSSISCRRLLLQSHRTRLAHQICVGRLFKTVPEAPDHGESGRSYGQHYTGLLPLLPHDGKHG